VLDDGSVVAIKRDKKFEHHMAVLGRLRHPNMVALNAYY
jgi:hypothetical protein